MTSGWRRISRTSPTRPTCDRTTWSASRTPTSTRKWSRTTVTSASPRVRATGPAGLAAGRTDRVRLKRRKDAPHASARATRPIVLKRPPRNYFAGAGSAGFSAGVEDFFAFLAFLALLGASALAASSARAAKEVARMRAAISFFMWVRLPGGRRHDSSEMLRRGDNRALNVPAG